MPRIAKIRSIWDPTKKINGKTYRLLWIRKDRATIDLDAKYLRQHHNYKSVRVIKSQREKLTSVTQGALEGKYALYILKK